MDGAKPQVMNNRNGLKWLLALAVALLTVAILVPLSNSEIRSFLLFKTAPEYARNAHFVRLKGDDHDLYLLGTIHANHLTSDSYSLWRIEAVIAHLMPNLLLVESRPEELASGHLGDGPIEMPFASMTARAMGIPLDGIDWWRKSGMKPGNSNSERDDRIFQNVVRRLESYPRVLVLVGYSHLAELQSRFAKLGYTQNAFTSKEKQALFSTAGRGRVYPPGLKNCLQKHVSAMQVSIEAESDPDWRSAMQANVAARQAFIEIIESAEARQSLPGRQRVNKQSN